MSIVTMMRDAAEATADAQRSGAPPGAPAEPPRQATIAADLGMLLPTEAVVLYGAILPFLVPKDAALEAQDFTSRWSLAIGVGILAVLFSVGTYKRALEQRGGRFRWPPRCTATVIVAYAAWVSAIPGSPMNSFSWYTPSLGAIIGLVACATISLIQLWFGQPER